MKTADADEFSNAVLGALVAALCVLGLGLCIVVKSTSKNRSRLHTSKLRLSAIALFIIGTTFILVVKFASLRGLSGAGVLAIGFWMLQASIAIATFRFWRHFLPQQSISPRLAESKISVNWIEGSPTEAFIGRSLVTGAPVQVCEHERAMHTLVSGSTGSGKTTILKSLFYDAVRKGQPVVIIDPKGNTRTINEFRAIARDAGRRADAFKLFSIINPDQSHRYNPISRGTPMQIRDRLMGSLEWSEPFYKNQASAWLGLTLDIRCKLKKDVTIHTLHELLVNQEALENLGEECLGIKDLAVSKLLSSKFRALSKFDKKNLDGLISQLRDLDSIEFGQILQPEPGLEAIELSQVIAKSEIAYFQLNTMAYEQAAKVIGKLILQDLKALASQIHGSANPAQETFLPIFVDEFGSFAFEGFVDFLKMSRDVKFANHLFFQSLADLDVVSPEFKSQVQQNCLTKIILRTDDPTEVEFWAGVAGTRDAVESSFQVENRFGFRMKTGQGNMRLTKQMRIEHDVFKRLRVGQAVLIQKAPAREDLLQLWMVRP